MNGGHEQSDKTDEKLVDDLIRRLQAEHERAGQLDNDRVLRIAERRNASPEVISAVRRRLTEMRLLAGTKKAAEVEGWSPPASDKDDEGGTGFDILGQYLDELGHYPLLVAEEEVVLGRRIRAARERLRTITESLPLGKPGEQDLEHLFLRAAAQRIPLDELDRRLLLDGADAEDQFYRSNLRLVVSVARRTYWAHPKLDPLDIIQAGNLGLVRAVQLFDHRMGYKFSTYATWWIRQAIERHVADAGRTIRLPVHMIDSIRALRNARRSLEIELGREPTIHEIGNWTGQTAERVQFLDDVARTTASLDAPFDGKSGATLADLVTGEWQDGPESRAERHLLRRAVMEALDDLNERDREIMVMRFGLDREGRARTLEEVGRMFNVTRERIRQVEKKSLRTLAHPNRAVRLLEVWDPGWPASPPGSYEQRRASATEQVLEYAETLAEPAAAWALECASALLEGEDQPMTPNEPWAGEVHAEVVEILARHSVEMRDVRATSRKAAKA